MAVKRTAAEERGEGKAWHKYAIMAINMTYPHMRNGIDFAWGKKDAESDPEMLAWDEKFGSPDLGKIEEVARKIAAENPYEEYKPGPGVPPPGSGHAAGEVPTKKY